MGTYFDSLSPAQKALPYASFMDFPYSDPPVPAGVAERMGAPIDPGKALQAADAAKLLDPAYDADDMGYCVMPDGSGYVGQTIHFRGVTRDMFVWWFAWGGLEDVRYKIWDPEAHIASCVSASHIGQRTNGALSYSERMLNTTNFTVHGNKDGQGDPGVMYFVAPEMFGLDAEAARANGLTIVAALHGKTDRPYPTMCSVRVLKDTPEGFVMRLYFWHSKTVYYGKVLPVPIPVEEAALQSFYAHAGQEYQHLADILPSLYARFGHTEDNAELFTTLPF